MIIPRTIRKARTGEYLGEWSKQCGKPTTDNLSDWRDRFNASLKPGGANAHLGPQYHIQCKLEIFDQRTKKVLATFNAPMFETI